MSSTAKYDSSEKSLGLGDGGALERAWPAGMPPDETAVWLQLDADARADAARRISALVAYEAAGAVNAPSFAQMASVSVPRFYVLLREWRKARSIRSVIPHGRSRRKPQLVDESLDTLITEALRADPAANVETIAQVIRKEHKQAVSDIDIAARVKRMRDVRMRKMAATIAKEMLADVPNAAKEDVARAIRAEMGDLALSLSLTRRIVDETRTSLERAKLAGAAGFGRQILLDSTALSLAVQRGDDTEWAVVFMVVDQATGFIIGWALGQHRHDSDTWLAAVATQSAVAELQRVELPSSPRSDDEPAFTIVLETADAVSILRETARLYKLPFEVEVISSGRRHGSRLLRTLGPRLGDLDLLPRYSTSSFRGRRPPQPGDEGVDPKSEADAFKIIEAKVNRHNSEVLANGISAAVPLSKLISALQKLYP